jgi:hypothetical protein
MKKIFILLLVLRGIDAIGQRSVSKINGFHAGGGMANHVVLACHKQKTI